MSTRDCWIAHTQVKTTNQYVIVSLTRRWSVAPHMCYENSNFARSCDLNITIFWLRTRTYMSLDNTYTITAIQTSLTIDQICSKKFLSSSFNSTYYVTQGAYNGCGEQKTLEQFSYNAFIPQLTKSKLKLREIKVTKARNPAKLWDSFQRHKSPLFIRKLCSI